MGKHPTGFWASYDRFAKVEPKPLLWVLTVMAIFMSSRRFMGRKWLVRDDFWAQFFGLSPMKCTFSGKFWSSFIWFIHSCNPLHGFSHVWPVSRCGLSKSAAGRWARVTPCWSICGTLSCCEGVIWRLGPKTVRGFVATQGTYKIIQVGHTHDSLYSHDAQNAVKSLIFRVVITEMYAMYAMYCYVHLCDWKPGCFFSWFSLQIPSAVTTLFTSTLKPNSWILGR